MKNLIVYALLLLCLVAKAQIQIPISAPAKSSDDGGKDTLSFTGGIDGYYALDCINFKSTTRPYATASSRLNQIALNLAWFGVGYTNERVRLQLTTGFGTFMRDNYANENVLNRFLLESYGGFKLSKKKGIWLDVGIFTSPYTYETPISKDQLLYSRSLAAENAPYYISGLRLTLPLSKKFTLTLYGINGWQTINFNNASARSIAFASQLQYKVKPNLSLYWNTFAGDAGSPNQQWLSARYFNDFSLVYTSKKWDVSATAYLGLQGVYNSWGVDYAWYSLNTSARYKFDNHFSLAGRLEYFSDPNGILTAPNQLQTRPAEFVSGSLGFNYAPVKNVLFRLEGRGYGGHSGSFMRGDIPVNYSIQLFSSLAVWF